MIPTVESFTLSGQAGMLMIPREPNGDLVVYHHGSGETEASYYYAPEKADLREALATAGYTVATSNAHGNNWGNQAAIDDYAALIAHVRSGHTVNRVLHLSQSMGGLAALTGISTGELEADGWAGIYPACNLAACYSSFAAAIDTAYGISGDYAAKTAGHDPLLRAAGSYTVPMRFYASPDDVTIPKTTNSDAMSAHCTSAPERTVVVCSGVHGDPSHIQPTDLLAFFARC